MSHALVALALANTDCGIVTERSEPIELARAVLPGAASVVIEA
ncbi:hypothetical protein [Bradyrhizobium cenepequi]